MKLPESYIEKMKALLGEEADAYFASLDEERALGVRVNTLKCEPAAFEALVSGFLPLCGGVPWCREGYYYQDSQPGRHPYYHAGLYYIQEPSAMFPAAAAGCRPGEHVLDLCAAPGGKSTQAACAMNGSGLLIANDISEERAGALVKNLEMAGVRNAVVTNEPSSVLARRFPLYFDRILVDAPCSGEGMFRKDREAVAGWESYKSERLRPVQDGILEDADRMLKNGGVLVYSTCTFSPLENERVIEAFLRRHPEYWIRKVEKPGGVGDGLPQYCEDPAWGRKHRIAEAARLWPHRLRGEGHFTALLQKGAGDGEDGAAEEETPRERKKKRAGQTPGRAASFRRFSETPECVRTFFRKNMTCDPWSGVYFTMGNFLYFLPEDPPDIDGIRVVRAGVLMGSVQYGELRPAHAFAMAAGAEEFRLRLELPPESDGMERYLKGETLTAAETWRLVREGAQVPAEAAARERGLCAVCAGRFPVGLGQLENGTVKNLYPKGWRRMR